MEKSLSMKVQWIKKEWATAKNLRNKTTGAVLFLGWDDGRPIVHLDQKDTTREDLASQSPDWCILFGKFYARTDKIPLSEKPQFLNLSHVAGTPVVIVAPIRKGTRTVLEVAEIPSSGKRRGFHNVKEWSGLTIIEDW